MPYTVIRYSKEEMMTYRQPVKMLSSMAELTEILSTERQNPVCFERFEPEDVRNGIQILGAKVHAG